LTPTLTPLRVADVPVLQPAVVAGFPRLSYTLDVLDGEIDPPEVMFGVGFDLHYMQTFLPQLRNDPLRRKIATGEVVVGATPVSFVNTGEAVVVQGRHLAGDPALLRWCLAEGVRTGVSFRVRLDRGRCGSLNFYSPHAFDEAGLEAALPAVFLAGHRAHALLSARCGLSRDLLLSRREVECLQAMARGGSNGQIARDLGLSIDTVKEYAQSLMRKLRARNRAEAVSRGHALNYL
jgi:DNA-binding CsgD family transcriptional regulator